MEQTNKQSGRIIAIIAMMFIYAMISSVTNLAAPSSSLWGATVHSFLTTLLSPLTTL